MYNYLNKLIDKRYIFKYQFESTYSEMKNELITKFCKERKFHCIICHDNNCSFDGICSEKVKLSQETSSQLANHHEIFEEGGLVAAAGECERCKNISDGLKELEQQDPSSFNISEYKKIRPLLQYSGLNWDQHLMLDFIDLCESGFHTTTWQQWHKHKRWISNKYLTILSQILDIPELEKIYVSIKHDVRSFNDLNRTLVQNPEKFSNYDHRTGAKQLENFFNNYSKGSARVIKFLCMKQLQNFSNSDFGFVKSKIKTFLEQDYNSLNKMKLNIILDLINIIECRNETISEDNIKNYKLYSEIFRGITITVLSYYIKYEQLFSESQKISINLDKLCENVEISIYCKNHVEFFKLYNELIKQEDNKNESRLKELVKEIETLISYPNPRLQNYSENRSLWSNVVLALQVITLYKFKGNRQFEDASRISMVPIDNIEQLNYQLDTVSGDYQNSQQLAFKNSQDFDYRQKYDHKFLDEYFISIPFDAFEQFAVIGIQTNKLWNFQYGVENQSDFMKITQNNDKINELYRHRNTKPVPMQQKVLFYQKLSKYKDYFNQAKFNVEWNNAESFGINSYF